MRKSATYCFFIFILLCKITVAQINFTVKKFDVYCNDFSLGGAKIIVSDTNSTYTYLWNTGQTTHSINNLVAGEYKVTVTDTSLNDTTVTFIINKRECGMEPEIFFTPNSDGINDTWTISNYQYFPNALILIYNRWGQKVFEHHGLYDLQWDGKDIFNVPVPDASYYYIIYQDQKKESELKKGSVSILR